MPLPKFIRILSLATSFLFHSFNEFTVDFKVINLTEMGFELMIPVPLMAQLPRSARDFRTSKCTLG